MSNSPRPKWLQSSADPTKVSLTIKGAVVFIPSAVTLATYFGVSLDPDTIAEAIAQLAAVASGAVTLYGIVRRIVITRTQ